MKVTSNVQQIGGEVTIRPAREEFSSADADQDVRVLSPISGLFLRRGGDEAILSEGTFSMGSKSSKASSERTEEKDEKSHGNGMVISYSQGLYCLLLNYPFAGCVVRLWSCG